MQQFAKVLERQIGSHFPLVHMDSPFALQFYLNTMRRRVSPSQAARVLASDYDAFVVVRDPSKLEAILDPTKTAVHEVARWPLTGEAYVRIVSNRPCLNHTCHTATSPDYQPDSLGAVRSGPLQLRQGACDNRRSGSGLLALPVGARLGLSAVLGLAIALLLAAGGHGVLQSIVACDSW
jgi:hypothetical protein